MQAAFVEIGLERAAFLHASDVMRSLPTPEIAGDEEAPPSQPQPVPPISELLRDGQEIVVQVVKDPIGSKGARLTTQISIPSRYLVLLPQSRRSEEQTSELQSLMRSSYAAFCLKQKKKQQ